MHRALQSQLKGNFKVKKKSFQTSTHIEIETSSPQVKALDKGKGIAIQLLKKSKGNKYFKCHGQGNFGIE